jgi:hypothetical protein
MPATSVRDLVIKDDDLVIGTHGRSFWILDDITPLRQLTSQIATAPVILYKPQQAIRVRWSMYTDTPIPQEESAGENPPDGAIINYYIKDKSEGEVTLEITDSKGGLIRKYSSRDTLYKIPDVNIPLYWIRPQQILSGEAGHHRFLWDMKYTPLNVPASYPISAIYGNTEPRQTAPWVMPGTYIVRLTVDGKTYSQPLTIKMDPRVKTSVSNLKVQHDLSFDCYKRRKEIMTILNEIANLRSQIKVLQSKANGELLTSLKQSDELLSKMQTAPRGSQEPGFTEIQNAFSGLFGILQETDMPPATQVLKTAKETKTNYAKLLSEWNMFITKQFPELNKQLQAAGMTQISL